ncbi:MAG: acyl-CoA reductase [Flavobacteriales bacterium]|nr:acyl-CoA reductase [Flavobacteriales bacterium]
MFAAGAPWPGHACDLAEAEYTAFDELVRRAHLRNGWATEENVRHALGGLSHLLDADALRSWLAAYPDLDAARTPRTVGLILAGNIPLVGFHDVLCVVLSGHRARIKCSSDDPELIPAAIAMLEHFAPGIADQAVVTTGKLTGIDAVIATGSTNTARYFEHYFGHLPRIVRKGRVSVAVLDGTETPEELAALGEDIFRYFGLGCRNVSKLYVPRDFDLDRLFGAIFPWKDIVLHKKYANNYDYHRALWMLDRAPFLENGFVVLKEEQALASPVAAVYYERYDDPTAVERALAEQAQHIQCVVGHGRIPFGTAQHPGPGEYADGVDTLRFLIDLP